MPKIIPLRSFVEGADHSLFSLYNLPYGIFRHGMHDLPRVGVAIGDLVCDLALLEQQGLLSVAAAEPVFARSSLNYFAALGPGAWSSVRERLQRLLSVENSLLQGNAALLKQALIPQQEVTLLLPFDIGAFTDFYASEQHASHVGRLFRPNDNPLLPNWKRLPVGYNGRASTVFVSGTPIRRPNGQIKLSPDADAPIFSPSRKLDFEVELGFFVGVGNPEGKPITVEQAAAHIFGCVLVNDWSARDIQAFEYQPLGPFLSKSFGTSISPWVVPYAALAPAMVSLGKQVPKPVQYLFQDDPQQPAVHLQAEILPQGGSVRTTLSQTNSKDLYWSMEQMLAHHTVNHCIMQPGDLLATGTISGDEKSSWGCLLEITSNGKEPVQLHGDARRTFLEDGDTVIMTGYCETPEAKIGFGSVAGMILPAEPVA